MAQVAGNDIAGMEFGDLTWVEPIAHDALVEYYDSRLADPSLAQDLARAHGRLWCRAANGQTQPRDLARFEDALRRVGLGHHDLADANAAVARELLDMTRARFRRSARGLVDVVARVDALDERVALGLGRRSA